MLSGSRLYLSRFYHYEQTVAEIICAMNRPLETADSPLLQEKLDEEFGDSPGNSQKLAALLALTRRLAIITGGPGTGKTLLGLEVVARAWLDGEDGSTYLYYSVEQTPVNVQNKLEDEEDKLARDV